MTSKTLWKFINTENAGSVLLLGMVVVAMAWANSPYAASYSLWHTPAMHLLVNDGLMSLFFLVIGIELKREICEGELCTRKKATLPLVGAFGGVLLPAAIYQLLNDDAEALRGWAIPMATDIAFTLGLVGFFATSVPSSLRVFLMALAVIDDLMAVAVIALFYTSTLNLQALAMVAFILGLLLVYQRLARSLSPFLLAGAALWIAVHESGIHATVAAVSLGLILPLPMGARIMQPLHSVVAFGVVPLFVLANAGVPLGDVSTDTLTHGVTLGIVLGLFVGKQLGIFGACALAIRLKHAELPRSVSWRQLYAGCCAAGIGFTMSLFIGTLAFEASPLMLQTRIGVVLGSIASAIFATILLLTSKSKKVHSPP